MKGIICGFLSGILLKEHVLGFLKGGFVNALNLYHEIHKKPQPILKNKSLISKIYIICKITNESEFNEWFPELNTKHRTQPMWEYFEHKKIIKIEVEPFLKEELINYGEFLNTTGLDIELFRSFSEMFIYIHYNINETEYINVYNKDSFIDTFDLKIQQTELMNKYSSIICATFNYNNKTEYITKYLKKYLNNRQPLTTEMLLLNYDKIDNVNVNLQIVNSKIINTYSLSETI
uniref:Uncharacterized protein n=1 Tax=viral metagenome TaxID=1070528 RepID=A0A6C0AZ92_9ZZZZ